MHNAKEPALGLEMNTSEYATSVENALSPWMRQRGFECIHLHRCVRPEVLFHCSGVWFGTSWDWRERVLDMALGRLYWLKDVMPRVIVLGQYGNYCADVAALDLRIQNLGAAVSDLVMASFDRAIVARALHPEAEAAAVKRMGKSCFGLVSRDELKPYEI